MDIKNIENYKSSIYSSLEDVCLKIVDISNYYILYTNENKFKDVNITFKGIEIILNVFSTIYLYSKNLEMATEYANNSIYYYIEYVSQISNKNSEFVFVNLTVKDAILYVYRKSVFELNDEIKKNYVSIKEESTYFETITSFIKTYNNILYLMFKNNNYENLDVETIKPFLYKINAYTISIFKAIEEYIDNNKQIENDIDVTLTNNIIEKLYSNLLELQCDIDNNEDYENLQKSIKEKVFSSINSIIEV
jgi:hypothetical protein|tara:strand:+ start:1033 stop:1779 length:747 start_codon:yes stop_codon:yes gene_type:complete